LANNKTKQARERLLALLKRQGAMPLEVIYSRCGPDFDALAGALSSLIEKEEVMIGRLKTRSGWLIGAKTPGPPDGGATWHTRRGQMRRSLPKVLKELKKYAPSREPPADGDGEGQLKAVSELLADGRPRSRAEIIAATGMEDIHAAVWRRFPQLPDGRYTLPDSGGAWDYLLGYIREKPRRLPDLLRLFSRHGEIVNRLAVENDRAPFVRMPRALITTTDSPEGKSELEHRRQVDRWKEALDSLPHPFFIPETMGLDPGAFRDLADSYTAPVEFAGKKYRCLRREFPGEALVEQLGEISGRHFAPPHSAGGSAFLKEHSVGEKEAANILGVDRDVLDHLLAGGELDYFLLDGKTRLWRSDLEDLKRKGAGLRELAKKYEKLTLYEAAVFLGISTDQLRRLADEGIIRPLSGGETRPKTLLFRRVDLEKLWENIPSSIPGPGSAPGDPAAGRRGAGKKKPRRREKTPPPAQEELVLDDFQIKAAEALRMGRSVLVAAPTGNGKTLVAEMLAGDLMAAGRGMVYTSPLKALSNQKFRDFRVLFGEEAVGLVTGDVSINPGAPILIMTTEIFRNWCFSEPEQLEKTSYVVFDEIHYLDDAERGTTWEESILFAPSHIRILGLSATAPNVEEMAHWIGSARGEEVVVIQENRRNVPLEIHWILPGGRIAGEEEARSEVEDLTEYIKALRGKRRWAEE